MGEDCSSKQRPWRAEEAVAGNARALQALRELIVYPIVYSREARILGLKWPRGLLLYGPPGTGKTSLVRAVVKESDAYLTLIRPQSVHRAHAGESEKFLREAFSEAYSHASSRKPSVIFIDEIDAICPCRDSRREHEARIVGQLLTLMDGSNGSSKSLPHVAVVASTNSGAELYSKYVGEGEALLRRTFQKARHSAPSIIFLDEADAIAPRRSGHGGNANGSISVGERLLSTLLTEMDGLELATGILVLAATNRPHAIDPALRRPGRFDLVLYVPPPDMEARYEILHIHTRQMKLGEDVDLREIAECTDLYTGADLEGLCREAGMVALREDIAAASVSSRHFRIARASLRPSLTQSQIEEYQNFMKTTR